jgi:hypothetical protein
MSPVPLPRSASMEMAASLNRESYMIQQPAVGLPA